MNMKKIALVIVFMSGLSSFCQVGINTDTPLRGIHIGGSDKNVRVEGLNEINHDENLGAGSTTRVYVNGDGDLTLGGDSEVDIELLVDTDNYLNNVENPTSVIIQTGTNLGYNTAGVPVGGINGASFTLTQNAILEVNYSVSYSIYDANALDKKRLDDLRARVIQTGIYFIDTATEIPIIFDASEPPVAINGGPWCIDTTPTGDNCLEWGGLLALAAQYYNNGSQVRGSYKNMRITASDYVRLGPGTYTALFAARVQVEETGGFGAAKMYLGSGNDELQIIAYYYD